MTSSQDSIRDIFFWTQISTHTSDLPLICSRPPSPSPLTEAFRGDWRKDEPEEENKQTNGHTKKKLQKGADQGKWDFAE